MSKRIARSYLTDVIAHIVAGHLRSSLDDMLHWTYAAQPSSAVA